MSYYGSPSRYPARPRGGAGVAMSRPANVLVLLADDKFATLNTYTDNRGNRVTTITLCKRGIPTGVDLETDNVAAFGEVEFRETMSPDDALATARAYLSGKGLSGAGL